MPGCRSVRTDPFGRTATFTYTGAGQLASVTDTLGLTSTFGYQAEDFVGTLTTPYGTTSFRHEADRAGFVNHPMIEATDPLGGVAHLEYHFATPELAATVPAAEVPTGFAAHNGALDLWNTDYWVAAAWDAGPRGTGGGGRRAGLKAAIPLRDRSRNGTTRQPRPTPSRSIGGSLHTSSNVSTSNAEVHTPIACPALVPLRALGQTLPVAVVSGVRACSYDPCVTVNVLPAILMIPERVAVPVFAATV